jgi:hypothetical protein
VKNKTLKEKNRSGKSLCSICGEEHILETHHIEGRNIPNPNHQFNLANICANCHKEVHWGNIIIEKWVMTSNGMELFWHKKGEKSFSGNDSIPHIIQKS